MTPLEDLRRATTTLQEKTMQIHDLRLEKFKAQRDLNTRKNDLVRQGAAMGKNETERNAQLAGLVEDLDDALFAVECELIQVSGELEMAGLEHQYAKFCVELEIAQQA